MPLHLDTQALLNDERHHLDAFVRLPRPDDVDQQWFRRQAMEPSRNDGRLSAWRVKYYVPDEQASLLLLFHRLNCSIDQVIKTLKRIETGD